MLPTNSVAERFFGRHLRRCNVFGFDLAHGGRERLDVIHHAKAALKKGLQSIALWLECWSLLDSLSLSSVVDLQLNLVQ